MKNVFFALLACLLTACFRAPHVSTLSVHHSATPAQTAVLLPPDLDGYTSADPVAAAGTATPEVGESYRAPAARPAYAPEGGEHAPAVKANPPTRPVQLRRALRKAVRAALLYKRPAAGMQEDPVPRKSALPAIALAAGLIGVLSLLGSIMAAVTSLGLIGGVLFALAFVGGLLGVILGGIARGRIRRGKDVESGRGKATAGLVLGLVDLALIFLLFILVLLIAIAVSGIDR